MLRNEDDVNKKLVLVKNLLNRVYEILKIFAPLLEEIQSTEEAKKYKKDGTFERAASIFGEISNICKEIEGNEIPDSTFLQNLSN